ncbi:11032_t:CDS:10 [Diversispora eburnea]|uniref:11032_t:CDS:1 n=1 Tax=Diversispora eburnea TaxID=1213867 RepID=A0A9N8UVW2_9GLOM|nr:11032_t:CDS:10 [Diversispora eburnea]
MSSFLKLGFQGLYKDWVYSSEVAEALETRKPVVALESTIISHGMPYPSNLLTALEVETIVRKNGSIPATIAILEGKVHVGLTLDDIEKLAKMGQKAMKTSRRDLAFITSQNITGATTVASTMFIAYKAGIKVFVTGGIGGVHRNGENTMDVSADLTELGRTPVTVVCAGVKSILDIEKTLEYLETQGVAVTTFGDTTDFPAFFTPKSGFKCHSNLATTFECAKLIQANSKLNLNSGILIAVPIPEEYAADAEKVESAIEFSLKETVEKGITGKDVTPYLLKRVVEITKGESLKSTKDLAYLESGVKDESSHISYENKPNQVSQVSQVEKPSPLANQLVIIGGAVVDIVSKLFLVDGSPSDLDKIEHYLNTSSPGLIKKTIGGVGKNIAETTFRLGLNPIFVSAIGYDDFGKWLTTELKKIGTDPSNLQLIERKSTAIYNAILKPNGNLLCGIADMSIFDEISVNKVEELLKTNKPKFVCFDGNISEICINSILNFCSKNKIPVPKAKKLFQNKKLFSELLETQTLRYITPDIYEFDSMFNAAEKKGLFDTDSDTNWFSKLNEFNIGPKFRQENHFYKECFGLQKLKDSGVFSKATQLLPYIPSIIIKLGRDGVLLIQNCEDIDNIKRDNDFDRKKKIFEIIVPRNEGKCKGGIRYKYFKPFPLEPYKIINVTGAGDSFVGTLIAGLTLYGESKIDKIIDAAQQIACMTLQSYEAVNIVIK